MVVTDEVLKSGTDVSPVQPMNMAYIFVTEEVSNKGVEVNAMQF